jgi:predicted peptidase
VIDKRLAELGRITGIMTENFAGELCGLDGQPIEFPPETGKERLEPNDVYMSGEYAAEDGTVIPYRYYLPEGYDESKKYPIVLYMHGNGSRGTDNERHLRSVGAALHTAIFRSEYDCIILAPQCTDRSMWCDIRSAAGAASFFDRGMGTELRAAVELYDRFVSEHSVDTDRQYFVGVSCGGAAAWELMYRYPSKFTAAIPIAGALEWDGAEKYAESAVGDTAVWTFHGTADKTCNVNATRTLYSYLSNAGVNIKYTEVKGASHGNIWTYAAEEPGVIDWLFLQRKRKT